jgi:hypothetical protein
MIKSRRMRWAGHAVCMEKIRNGKLKGKRPHGRPRRRQEDNIRMDIGEVEWEGMG